MPKSPIKLDIEVPDDYEDIKKLAESDVNFVVKKDVTYGGSWRKRGGVGAFMMLARKIDRLENFAKNHSKQYDIFDLVLTAEDPEDILDDLTDLRCYLLLVESYVRRQLKSGIRTDVKLSDILLLKATGDPSCEHNWDSIEATTNAVKYQQCRKCGLVDQ